MKKILYFAAIGLAALFTFTSCEDDPVDVTLEVGSATEIAVDGGTTTFTITSNSDWTITKTDEWISLDKETGSNDATITVTAGANTGEVRSSNLTVKAGDKTKTVKITQAGTVAPFITPATATATAEGGEVTFSVASNVAWTIASNDAWITDPTPVSGENTMEVTVTVAANSGDARTGTLTVTGPGELTATITVNQDEDGGSTGFITPATIPATAEGGDVTFSVASNVAWTIASNDAWITDPTPASGENTMDVAVTVAANSGDARTGTLTVTGPGELTATITVNQAAGGDLTGDTWAISFDGGAIDSSTGQPENYPAFQNTVNNVMANIDADGDGWRFRPIYFVDNNNAPTGEMAIIAESYGSSAPLRPDNYLIAPRLTMIAGAQFHFTVYAMDANYSNETFTVVISDQPITMANCANAEEIYRVTLPIGIAGPDQAVSYDVDIPDSYAGGDIYVGLRHCDSYDLWRVAISAYSVSNVTFDAAAPAMVAPISFNNVAPNYMYVNSYRK